MKLPPVNYRNRWLYFFATYLYVIVLYMTTNHLHAFEPHYLPLTPVDAMTPFVPWTGWIYISVYIFPALVGFIVKADEDIMRVLKAFVGMTTVCTIIFILYPTVYPRPELIGAGFADSLPLKIVRLLDSPANCMPSQHVGLAFLAAFFIQRYKRAWGTGSIFLAVAISVSTLTTKQHYIWDVVTGYIMARLTYFLTSGPTGFRSDIVEAVRARLLKP